MAMTTEQPMDGGGIVMRGCSGTCRRNPERMGRKTEIQWTDATWNCVRGCTRVSPGCEHCYAERFAARFSGVGHPWAGFAGRRSSGEPKWTGEVALIPTMLTLPLRWRRPRRIFVNSMSDLFHEALTDDRLDRMFAVMALCPQHQFQVLTKRPERMLAYCSAPPTDLFGRLNEAARSVSRDSSVAVLPTQRHGMVPGGWPLANVWLGVSVEDQRRTTERLPVLLATPAAVRFLSCEPLLGPISLGEAVPDWWETAQQPLWVIVGGESGPHARGCKVAWIRDLIGQCRDAGVPCFVKQLGSRSDLLSLTGSKDQKGGNPAQWPEDLRVREWPTPGGDGRGRHVAWARYARRGE